MSLKLNIIVLAAGHSTRMNSIMSKIFHEIGGFPVIEHLIYNIKSLNVHSITFVIDEKIHHSMQKILQKHNINAQFVFQYEKLGTGHATNIAFNHLPEPDNNEISVILYGDTPFITAETIMQMINKPVDLTLLGFMSNNKNYGKIVINKTGEVLRIAEKEYDNSNLFIANSGILVGKSKVIKSLLQQLNNNNDSKEYYLTDLVEIAIKNDLKVSYVMTTEDEAIGINNKCDLSNAEKYFQERRRNFFLNNGVTLISPENTFFSLDTKIDRDVIIYPYVVFGKNVKIEAEAQILSFSNISDCIIKLSAVVGPFVHIRGNTVVGSNSNIGNFVELKGSIIGNNNKIKHLSYLGDTYTGDNVNIGAGTVVCNYDGKTKNQTTIENNCFVGANSTLIAPLKLGYRSIVAAGSVIVENLPEYSLGIAREKQVIKVNYMIDKEN